VCADQAHSSVERAGLLGGVKLRLLPADENLRLRGETLERAIQEDRDKGLIPFYVSTASTDCIGLAFRVYTCVLQHMSQNV
jgi:glutamate/tyrosine decarboxylase-like PLP-dependent enzyme